MKENLTVKEVLKVFDGEFPAGRAKDQPCRHSDAFAYISEGEAEYTFLGKKYIAKPKSIIFFPRKSAYEINILSPMKYICIDFNFEDDPSISKLLLFRTMSTESSNEFPKLLKIYLMKSPWHIPSLFQGVYKIYAEVLKSENANYKKISPVFSDITAYILENLQNPEFAVPDIASRFKISEVHLRRIFKSATGTSPIRYINHLRLEKAKTMLSESSMKISEIALLTGFSDPYYFSRIFKKETGISPASFRPDN